MSRKQLNLLPLRLALNDFILKSPPNCKGRPQWSKYKVSTNKAVSITKKSFPWWEEADGAVLFFSKVIILFVPEMIKVGHPCPMSPATTPTALTRSQNRNSRVTMDTNN